eukprot:364269-Chlamydomonas_euryale.AAC.5
MRQPGKHGLGAAAATSVSVHSGQKLRRQASEQQRKGLARISSNAAGVTRPRPVPGIAVWGSTRPLPVSSNQLDTSTQPPHGRHISSYKLQRRSLIGAWVQGG